MSCDFYAFTCFTFAIYKSAVYCTEESLFEVKTEADSNDITEHPHDDKPTMEIGG